ncbi:TPA: DUF1542 domain-containing protein [Streptococcus pyogenes]
MLKTVTVTKDQQNPISITLTEEEAKALKNKEQLKVSIKQKQSKKTSKDFYLEVGIDPEVKAKQKEKLLELDKVKKQIEDLINGDAWLPEKPEGEKPVQNTNKELQLQELNKKYQMAKEAIESATTLEKVTEKYNEYTFEGEKEKYPNSLRNQYTKGNREKEISNAEISLNTLKEKFIQKISDDPWLSDEVKQKQKDALLKLSEKVNKSINSSNDLKSLREIMKNASSEGQNHPDSIPDQYVPGKEQEVKTAEKAKLQPLYEKVIADIEKDPWLTKEQKESQKEKVKEAFNKAKTFINDAPSLAAINEGIKDYTLDESLKVEKTKPDSIPNQYAKGNKQQNIDEAIKKLKKAHEDTKQAIEQDPWLSPEQKKAQKENAKARLDAGLKAVETTESLDKLKEVESDFLKKEKAESIPSQHQAGTPEVARKTFLDNFEKEAKKEIESIDKDDTLTANAKQVAKDKVAQQLQEATAKVEKAQSFDDLKKVETEFVTALPHTKGEKLNQQQTEAISGLEGVQKATEKAISEDKTLSKDEKKKQIADSKERLKSDTQKVKDAKNADAIKKAFEEGKVDIPQAHIPGDLNKDKEKLLAELKQKADDTEKAIDSDKTLTAKEKEEQSKAVDAELKKAIEAVNAADTADKVDDALGKGVTDIKNQHKTGDPVVARREAHGKQLDRVAQETKDAIEKDPTLTTEEKAKQVKDVDAAKERGMAKLTEAKNADELDKAYGEGVTDIKNQHKSGDPIEARRGLHNKSIDEVAQATKDAITADTTLTEAEKETQRGNVDKEATKAKEELAKAKDADALDKAYGDGVTAIENAHVIGKGIEARKDLAKKDLAEAAAKTKALIIEDKTLTDDQRKEQLLGVDTEYAKGIENIDAAKDAAGVDKAYSDGVRDILAQYKEGQNLNDRRNAAKEFLLKEADKVTKLINDDPTLTHDQKVDQINKVEQAKLDAIKSVDDAQTADAINDALGKGIENINNQYQHGDGVDVRKATAKGDLEKEAAKVKALIAKDPTLTQADKDKQTAAVDAAKNTAIAAVDKATTADGVNQELGKGITAINKAYRPGEAVKARKEAAKADLEKEAAKVKALIAKDPTLTQADKDKQTAAVDAAKNTAIAAVDKATTAEGINQELGKGITAINKAYRSGEGVKARKEAAKADLEKEAAKVKALITNDPTLTKADKAKQTEAVAKALKAAIAAVDKATTAEGINQELGKGITAINKAYRPGEGVKARKEAAKANLEKVAKETKALISGDRYLSETEKAVQKQAVEQALAKALGQVEAAKTVEAVKLAENLGTVAIRSAYVAGLAKDTDQATAALNEAKQAAIEALKQAAAETLAKITTDAKLTEAQKAEQSENVSLALKTAIATVRSAQSIASVKEAIDKGITAIRAAYVPNKAVAKSSSANHLPKSGDANSIVLVGLGVMSLLLGMVLYSKKKESKD